MSSSHSLVWLRKYWQNGLLLALLVPLYGCGLFGKKEEPPKTVSFLGTTPGCLNEFGPELDRYLKGTGDLSKWNALWDCTMDSLGQFKKFVRGSQEGGFTQADMRGFIAHFLITDMPVTENLVHESFRIKASVFGGEDDFFTFEEVDKLTELLKFIKTSSGELYPALMAFRQNSQDLGAIFKLRDGIQLFASDLAKSLRTLGPAVPPMPKQGERVFNAKRVFTEGDLRSLLTELEKIFQWKFPVDLLEETFWAKELVFGGGGKSIEGELWPELVQLAGVGISQFFVWNTVDQSKLTGPNPIGEFYLSMMPDVRKVVEIALRTHHQGIPMAKVDEFIDRFVKTEALGWVHKPTVKKSLRPFFKKVFFARNPEFLDGRALGAFLDLIEEVNRQRTTLETVFDDRGLDPQGASRDDFIDAVTVYRARFPETWRRKEIDHWIHLAKTYRPIFQGNDEQMSFIPLAKYSFKNLWMTFIIEKVSKYMVDVYGQEDKNGVRYMLPDDFKKPVIDFGILLFELGLIDHKDLDLPKKRVKEADIFTLISNGDGRAEVPEWTYYFASLWSSRLISIEFKAFQQTCRLKPSDVDAKGVPYLKTLGEQDAFHWYWMSARCVREHFIKNSDRFLSFSPVLNEHFNHLTKEEKYRFLAFLEEGGRKKGYNQLPMASSDVEGMSGLLHYIEGVFLRFDRNHNQAIDADEAAKAFPIFKKIMAEAGGLAEDSDLLEPAFTYVLNYGEQPTTSLWGGIKFLRWKWSRPWSFSAGRSVVYSIVPVMLGGKTPTEIEIP